ncbi:MULTISPECIES: HAD family hydrolase [Thermomonosporaceae]|uniref:HAD family hydrolase n=1 Tax=Thermomonosporaceae TaxID=2012 RepID=UPI00255AC5A3|nr:MULTISPECIES: haloacid dehalogenase-like hydrolase [Thermomonosporaceae]MDL4775987.1 haloacid dehalogenase-like hydrolase [Actinomadura xylanilytica]
MSTLNRLVLWNIDHTLVDVGRVTRESYAEAFQRTTGRPLVRLPPTPGRTESELIFETLAFNDVVTTDDHLPAFMTALAEAFAARRGDLRTHGRVLAGAREAVEALSRVPGLVQSVLTGSVRPNAVLKLTELGLAAHLDLDGGGYENGVYSKAALLELARTRAAERHGTPFPESTTVYIADSPRDVQAAHIAGSPIIAVATGSATEAELRAAGADIVLATLADTRALVTAVADLTRL